MCMHNFRFFGRYKRSDERVVVVGLHRRSQPDRFAVRVNVSKMIFNTKFGQPGPAGTQATSDIMLLKLAHPVELNDAVSLVCLPYLFQVLPAGKRCYSTGWGSMSSK